MMYAIGYNLLLGTSGLPSFGHGAFFGVGAYAFGLLELRAWPNFWFDLGGAVAIAALAGAAVGAFISHRRGIYYALLTIAFGQVFWFVAVKWHSVTGGEDGLLNVKRLAVPLGLVTVDTRPNEALFYVVLVALLLVIVVCWRCVHSPFGRVLRCIKQNEQRARFLGYRVWIYKWLVFVLSAAIAGLSGALFAMAQQSAYPNVMSLQQSGFVVMMVLIGGGLVSFWGPVLGAAFFILARDLLGAYTETWLLWYGLLTRWRAGEGPRRCRCSKPSACTSDSATAWCWRRSTSRSTKGPSPASWGPTAPARRPASIASPACTRRTAARSAWMGARLPDARPTR
jgi:branched-chain amino acid transport system permease protein